MSKLKTGYVVELTMVGYAGRNTFLLGTGSGFTVPWIYDGWDEAVRAAKLHVGDQDKESSDPDYVLSARVFPADYTLEIRGQEMVAEMLAPNPNDPGEPIRDAIYQREEEGVGR